MLSVNAGKLLLLGEDPVFAAVDGCPDAFYKGEIADAIVKTSQHLGGTMTEEDLAAFEPEWVTPISIDYRGWNVYELPPNGQGVAALEMLKIMSTRPPFAAGPLSPRNGTNGSKP